MNKETENTKIDNPTVKKMQLIVQEYFKNVLGLPCPDFTLNLGGKNSQETNKETRDSIIEEIKHFIHWNWGLNNKKKVRVIVEDGEQLIEFDDRLWNIKDFHKVVAELVGKDLINNLTNKK